MATNAQGPGTPKGPPTGCGGCSAEETAVFSFGFWVCLVLFENESRKQSDVCFRKIVI